MARVRMSWDWVGRYPVFVYTTFIDHFKFNVKVVIGKKGDQNAQGFGPGAKGDLEYLQTEVSSKREVVDLALKRAAEHLNIKPAEAFDVTHDESYTTMKSELPPWEEEENSHDSNKL